LTEAPPHGAGVLRDQDAFCGSVLAVGNICLVPLFMSDDVRRLRRREFEVLKIQEGVTK
jgi:hypothetical protein